MNSRHLRKQYKLFGQTQFSQCRTLPLGNCYFFRKKKKNKEEDRLVKQPVTVRKCERCCVGHRNGCNLAQRAYDKVTTHTHKHTQINEIKHKLEGWVKTLTKRCKEEAHVGARSRVLEIIDVVQPKTSTTPHVSTTKNQDGPRKRVSPQRRGSTTSYLCTAVRQMCQLSEASTHRVRAMCWRVAVVRNSRSEQRGQRIPNESAPRCRSINEDRQCLLHKRGSNAGQKQSTYERNCARAAFAV